MKYSINESLVKGDLFPIFTHAQSIKIEEKVFSNKDKEWEAMQKVAELTAEELIEDFKELKSVPDNLSVVVLSGKGKNGGDSLCVCDYIIRKMPRARVSVLLHCNRSQLNPLAEKALLGIEERAKIYSCQKGINQALLDSVIKTDFGGSGTINLFIDGLLGLGIRAPLKEFFLDTIEQINNYSRIDMRASIDLPSGLLEQSSAVYFKADFIYLSAIPKKAVFQGNARFGRVRFIDIGLMKTSNFNSFEFEKNSYIISSSVLKHFSKLRSPMSEKRVFGHLFIVGGSQFLPGALLMSVKAAIQSGAGLVTAFAPNSIVPVLASEVPEAMWVPLPQNNLGTLSQEAAEHILEHAKSATALVIGPGLGRTNDTEFVVQKILQEANLPLLLDADALTPRVTEMIQKRRTKSEDIILTPHIGEFLRMTKLANISLETKELLNIIKNIGAIVVLKSGITRISDGKDVYFNTHGGPVFSRGGSGDILAGIIGAQLANPNTDGLSASILGVTLHGHAGELLARKRGQVMVRTTEVLDYLAEVIR